jgi:hypothetical protein
MDLMRKSAVSLFSKFEKEIEPFVKAIRVVPRFDKTNNEVDFGFYYFPIDIFHILFPSFLKPLAESNQVRSSEDSNFDVFLRENMFKKFIFDLMLTVSEQALLSTREPYNQVDHNLNVLVLRITENIKGTSQVLWECYDLLREQNVFLEHFKLHMLEKVYENFERLFNYFALFILHDKIYHNKFNVRSFVKSFFDLSSKSEMEIEEACLVYPYSLLLTRELDIADIFILKLSSFLFEIVVQQQRFRKDFNTFAAMSLIGFFERELDYFIECHQYINERKHLSLGLLSLRLFPNEKNSSDLAFFSGLFTVCEKLKLFFDTPNFVDQKFNPMEQGKLPSTFLEEIQVEVINSFQVSYNFLSHVSVLNKQERILYYAEIIENHLKMLGLFHKMTIQTGYNFLTFQKFTLSKSSLVSTLYDIYSRNIQLFFGFKLMKECRQNLLNFVLRSYDVLLDDLNVEALERFSKVEEDNFLIDYNEILRIFADKGNVVSIVLKALEKLIRPRVEALRIENERVLSDFLSYLRDRTGKANSSEITAVEIFDAIFDFEPIYEVSSHFDSDIVERDIAERVSQTLEMFSHYYSSVSKLREWAQVESLISSFDSENSPNFFIFFYVIPVLFKDPFEPLEELDMQIPEEISSLFQFSKECFSLVSCLCHETLILDQESPPPLPLFCEKLPQVVLALEILNELKKQKQPTRNSFEKSLRIESALRWDLEPDSFSKRIPFSTREERIDSRSVSHKK